ncbi:MAG: helix-turn-helix domain-containing protein, partial [Bacteroidota bacterium]
RPEAPWLSRLSEREKEILSLLAKGCENREIARRLYIAEQTVKNYVSDIYCKIGVRDRVQAARLAAEAGLV